MTWSPAKIEDLIRQTFPAVTSFEDLESQLSSLETMELLLTLEKALGSRLQAIELEPLLHGNFALFCQIANDKRV